MKTEKRFVVQWEIDEFCSNPLEAIKKAILAFPHEGNEDTIATVFDVAEIGENGRIVNKVQIDVLDEGCNPFSDEDVKNYVPEDFNAKLDAMNKAMEEDEAEDMEKY